MITSQTCDIAGPRAKKHPFVLVAPVYNIAGHLRGGQENQIRGNLFREFIPLDGPRFIRDGELWAADLRFESSLEKGALLDRAPIDAFASDASYLLCRTKIGRAHFRPAISNNVEKYVLEPLRERWRSGALDPRLVRDFIVKATPKTVAANAVRLYIIVHEGIDPDPIREQYEEWVAELAPSIPEDLQFLGMEVRSPVQFTWADFEGAEIADPMELSVDDDF
jgi:hypothetical protein